VDEREDVVERKQGHDVGLMESGAMVGLEVKGPMEHGEACYGGGAVVQRRLWQARAVVGATRRKKSSDMLGILAWA
jgi:hypothetical protein